MEIKSLINSNFGEILDQIHATIFCSVDNLPDCHTFVIAMKAGKIAFFEYHGY